MEITAYKCEKCSMVTESFDKYSEHVATHVLEGEFEKEFHHPEDPNLKWANGEFAVQRDKEWLEKLKERIVQSHKTDYEPFSYAFFRSLDDGGSWLYKWAIRVNNTCETCYREYGQGYYTTHCKHTEPTGEL